MASLETLSTEQMDFIRQCELLAGSVAQEVVEADKRLGGEVFPEGKLDERVQVLAQKTLEYVVQCHQTDRDIASPQTVADALVELAPSNHNPSSRRYHKAKIALEEWFDPEHEGKKSIGSTLMSVVDHHERRVAQRAGELRNRQHNSEARPPELLFTTDSGVELYELTTKAHLEQESGVNHHCIGTGTYYAQWMKRGERRFFSLRNHADPEDSPYRRLTIDYDVNTSTVRQIRGRGNKGVDIGYNGLASLARALAYIRDEVVMDEATDFTVSDLSRYGVFEDRNLEALQVMGFAGCEDLVEFGINFQKVNILIDDNFDPSVIPEARDALAVHSVQNLTIDIDDPDTVAAVVESVGGIHGNLSLPRLRQALGLEGLPAVGGSLLLPELTDARGLDNLEIVGGRAYFGKLEVSEGLFSLASIGKAAILMKLREATGLRSLTSIGKRAHFESLESAVGLENLRHIGGRAYFNSLATAEGLDGLEYIGSYLYANVMKETGRRALRKLIHASRKQKKHR